MRYKMEMSYKLKGNVPVNFYSDWINGDTAILLGEDIERVGNVRTVQFIDEMNQNWNLKELRKLNKEVKANPHDVHVYFDGGFDKMNKRAGLGVVVYYKLGHQSYRLRVNEEIHELDNNNEAEYAALLFALNSLDDLGVRHVPCEILGDSQVVLKQLEGEWPCYEENLNTWLDRIEEKIKGLGIGASYRSISRNENKEADKLASQALEGKRIRSTIELEVKGKE